MSPNNDTFEFRQADHSYWLNGNQIPSATQIIKLCGLVDDRWYKEEHRVRGTLVHAACHQLSEKDMDWKAWEEAHPELLGFIRAYEKFLGDSGFEPEICEKPNYHKNYLYACTIDNIGKRKIQREIVELKSGAMMPWTAIQTALQAIVWFPDDFYSVKRTGLELSKDGTYRSEEFNDPNDFNVAIGMVGVAHWILKNGGKI